MTDEECQKLGIMTDSELKAMDDRMNKVEDSGLIDLVKYFDRINDKLFQLNNMIIAGYFALIVINPSTSPWLIFIPLINFVILLFVDWQMMEKSRLESRYKSLTAKERAKYDKLIKKSTLNSLATIVSTIIVTAIFAVLIIFG